MDGVFCNNCGHRNPADANFCSSCGAVLTAGTGHHGDPAPRRRPGRGRRRGAHGDPARPPSGTGLLVVKRGPNAGTRFVLEADVTRVGRHPESDIFLDDITVSRRHAEFVKSHGGYTVRDVGSLNGTYVNRERIEEAVLASATRCRSASSSSSTWRRPTSETPPAGRHGERPDLPVDRRRPRPAAPGVPRRHHLEDPLPREPGARQPGADPVGVPQVLRAATSSACDGCCASSASTSSR